MKLYHGTDEKSAEQIVKKIDVTKGGGELGRGFYMGENIALAAAIGYGNKGLSLGKVVSLDIDEHKFVKLHVRTFNKRQLVYENWKHLLTLKKSKTHVYGTDVIVGPFATIEFSYQYKFESKKSENVLNFHTKKEIL